MTAEPANPTPERSYVIVITARDEAKYLQGTIDSIAGQTLLPVELVIVDDGSKDETGAIADAAAAQYPWVHVVHRPDRGERKVGAGVVETFYAGYEALQTRSFAYQCKLDRRSHPAARVFRRNRQEDGGRCNAGRGERQGLQSGWRRGVQGGTHH